jgi:aarF domain-containing kinase
VPGLEEIEKQFQTEFDYKQEAEQLLIAHDNLVKAGLAGPGKLCCIPKPYMQYCTRRVLVMEELFGEKLAVELKNDIEHHAARQGLSAQEYVALQLSKFEEEERRTGMEALGPSAESYRLFIALADGQRQMRNAWARLYNMTVGWLPGKTSREYVSKRDLPLNHAQLVDDLIYVHGHEVLVDGHFNGGMSSPHALLLRFDQLPNS